MPASTLAVDDAPHIGIYLESDDTPLKPGSHGLTTLAPRIIDLMLASNESSHVALDTKNGATIVRSHGIRWRRMDIRDGGRV